MKKKRESKIVKMWFKYLSLMSFENFDDYNEDFFESTIEKLHDSVSILSKNTLIERFMLFFANEIEMAIKNRDSQRMEELFNEWLMWADYIWYKA